MTALEEQIVFQAMESMNAAARVLVPVLNEHKSPEAAEAYKSGVYAVSMKLGMLLGLEAIKRQKAVSEQMDVELEQYFKRRAEKREERKAKLARGQVWCRECGRTQKVKNGLTDGWPKCCGFTMTIDSPEEPKAPRNHE